MGMLDDAIREHLELKRRRGADPGEVAREQHEALDPVTGAASAAPEDELHDDAELESADLAHDADAKAPVEPPQQETPMAHAPGDGLADETAELDMRTVLGEDEQARAEDAAVSGPVSVRPSDETASGDEESLEWEMPGEQPEEPAEPQELEEDVLEETPDFLRETPEHERLWFEQRPPRDFDFDK